VAAYAFSRLFRCFGHRPHRHVSAALEALLELDFAADFGEQSVVLAHGHIGARMHLGAALAHNDVARKDDLTAEALTPSRWLLESRPLREDPPAFLCAMNSFPKAP